MSKNQQHKRAFLVWLAICPLITALFFFFGDWLLLLPLPLRTLVLTAVAVPTVFYVIMPVYARIFRKWLE